MQTTPKTKPKKRATDSSTKDAEPKKLSQFGKAMLKYRGYVEILDMKAVLK